MKTTIHFPLPSGKVHPGGRLQRKSRLRKKQTKYRIANGYSFVRTAVVSDGRWVEVDGELTWEVIYTLT